MEILAVAIFGTIAILLVAAMVADMTARLLAFIVGLLVLAGVGYVVYHSDVFQSRTWTWGLPAVPSDETTFLAVADEMRSLRSASEASTTGAERLHQVEARICALPRAAKAWVGRVEFVYPTGAGDFSLAIRIALHIVVRTALFPDNTGTLIRRNSPIFTTIGSLRPGEPVRFDGALIGFAGACPGDQPISANDKLRDPEFLVQFSRISATEAQ